MLHVGCALHLYPSVVPLHVPLRYCDEAHCELLQVLHLYPLVVPPHEPDRNLPDAHLRLP